MKKKVKKKERVYLTWFEDIPNLSCNKENLSLLLLTDIFFSKEKSIKHTANTTNTEKKLKKI